MKLKMTTIRRRPDADRSGGEEAAVGGQVVGPTALAQTGNDGHQYCM